jgi:hypothetical protein
MFYTQKDIDQISVIASNTVKQEFAEHGDCNPPVITPGMVRNVLKVADAISSGSSPCRNTGCEHYDTTDPDGFNCPLFYPPSSECEGYRK